jgi:ABC-2 type transport system ATP-binding protein
MCDSIAILGMGSIKKSGNTKDLLDQLDNKLLIIYPEKKLRLLPKFPVYISSSIRSDGAVLLSFNKSDITTEELITLCKGLGISIRDIATTEPALEDVFKQVTASDKVL